MGDYKTGNLCYKDIVKAVSYLKENNQLSSLRELLKHPSVVTLHTRASVVAQGMSQLHLNWNRIIKLLLFEGEAIKQEY